MQNFASTSQSDIIRTLVSRNCVDESVMSMVLSPDCTPQKLLERLMEAERFDLALDVSTKMGLDVAPLWRTWAQRCLRSRNFPGAREKFRHCFMGVRLPGTRTSPLHSKLLVQILKDLVSMDERQLSLSEEIELIKARKYISAPEDYNDEQSDSKRAHRDASILSRPNIYAECLYYLNAHGNVEDKIQFYCSNSIFLEGVKILLSNADKLGIDKVFVHGVLMDAVSTGRLNHLIGAFMELDSNFNRSAPLFKTAYEYLSRNKRYNLLYFIQNSISDNLAAAEIQITHFFLEKSVRDYRDLNHRLPSLICAQNNYLNHLEKLEIDKTSHEIQKANNLFLSLSETEVRAKLATVNLQIEITRNFALNEVPGCINNIDLGFLNDRNDVLNRKYPVTIFDVSNCRKTFLAALVLMYFDPSCRTNFSKRGLELSNQIIDEYKLDKMRVFKTCMRIIIEDESCDILENAGLLLERVREDFISSQQIQPKRPPKGPVVRTGRANKNSRPAKAPTVRTINLNEVASSGSKHSNPVPSNKTKQSLDDIVRQMCDDIICDAISVCKEPDYKMELAKLLSDDAKIKHYVEHGKLNNAQTLAFQMNRSDYVSNIMEEASRLNQDHIKTVCQHWLAKRGQ